MLQLLLELGDELDITWNGKSKRSARNSNFSLSQLVANFQWHMKICKLSVEVFLPSPAGSLSILAVEKAG